MENYLLHSPRNKSVIPEQICSITSGFFSNLKKHGGTKMLHKIKEIFSRFLETLYEGVFRVADNGFKNQLSKFKTADPIWRTSNCYLYSFALNLSNLYSHESIKRDMGMYKCVYHAIPVCGINLYHKKYRHGGELNGSILRHNLFNFWALKLRDKNQLLNGIKKPSVGTEVRIL